MKKSFKLFGKLAGAFLGLTIICQPAHATHYQGADITYAPVAPNVYIVTAKIYRDCSASIALDQAISINMQAPGCNTGRNLNASLAAAATVTGNPYCRTSAHSGVCATTSQEPNYQTGTYNVTMTFSAVEQTCSDWYFSIRLGNRPSIENLVNGQSAYLYTEAFLKLNNQINNASAQFGAIGAAVPFAANIGMPMTYSNNAVDADGDSIVYSLVRALDNATTPIAYANIGTTGPFIENKNPSPPFNTTTNKQYAAPPTGMTSYNATFPLPSFLINWNSPNQVVQALPHFEINPYNGNLTFMPGIYNPNTTLSAGRNRYTVVVQADEFRKVNGVVTKVGHIRRDMIINVVDGGANANPDISMLSVNNFSISPDSLIRLRPGIPLNLQLDAEDLNTADSVFMQTDVMQRISGAVFMKSPGLKPTGTVTWTPTAAHIRPNPYYFTVYLKDDACPVRGMHARTIGVSVTANGAVTGTANKDAEAAGFKVYPNPFGSETKFRLTINKPGIANEIVIFNALGQQVDKISLKNLTAGQQEIEWKNAALQPAGHYVARLTGAENVVQTIKFVKLN